MSPSSGYENSFNINNESRERDDLHIGQTQKIRKVKVIKKHSFK